MERIESDRCVHLVRHPMEHCPQCLTAALCKAEAEVARLDALNRELAVDIKEWRIRFPVNDPTIARRMVEDRARAEADAALATERAGREEAEALVVWCAERDLRARMAVDGTHYIEWTPEGSDGSDVLDESYDGTDAGLRAAVREGREGNGLRK